MVKTWCALSNNALNQLESWPMVRHCAASHERHNSIAVCHCRAEEKGGLREFLPARVNVVLQEISAGLQMHKSCPGLLRNALSHEAVRNAFAHG